MNESKKIVVDTFPMKQGAEMMETSVTVHNHGIFVAFRIFYCKDGRLIASKNGFTVVVSDAKKLVPALDKAIETAVEIIARQSGG